jgi:hypothetical protein
MNLALAYGQGHRVNEEQNMSAWASSYPIVSNATTLSVPRSLKAVGLVTGSLGVLGLVLATLAYAVVRPGFDLLATYLSDIGATPVWPQVFWNAALLVVSPLRYVVLVLLVLRLYQLGAGRAFGATVLILGVFTTAGTIITSAVPYTVDVNIHKLGMPLFFFGLVLLQTVVGVREWQLKAVPRVLPILCFVVVAAYLTFFTLEMLYEANMVSRNTPVPWEWLCALSLLTWVFAHSVLLGKEVALT